MTIYYCVHKTSLAAISAGPLPDVWGNISGMADLSPADAADLTWAGYDDYGFYQRADALAFGVSQASIDAADATYALVRGEDNARRAKQELLDSDWCEYPSVRDTSVFPHLANGSDFDAYRLVLRAITVNNTPDVETWPERPTAVWVQE